MKSLDIVSHEGLIKELCPAVGREPYALLGESAPGRVVADLDTSPTAFPWFALVIGLAFLLSGAACFLFSTSEGLEPGLPGTGDGLDVIGWVFLSFGLLWTLGGLVLFRVYSAPWRSS